MAKVLVVDDSLSVRKVVERALAGRQIEVVCAASGMEALERIERDEPDVVVCDVVMPDKDGYEICEFVRRHPRLGATPVLLMSGIVNDTVRERAAAVRSSDVLSKPFAADDLVKRLEALLAARPPAVEMTPGPAPISAPPMPPVSAMPVSAAPMPVSAAPMPVMAAPMPVIAAAPAPLPAAPAPDLRVAAGAAGGVRAVLEQFAAIDGVQWAVLADREGFLLESAGQPGVDTEVAGALSACLAESSEGLGRELGRGALQGMILEYEKGMVVLYGAGPAMLLGIGLIEPAVLGKVRYYAKKALPELMQAA